MTNKNTANNPIKIESETTYQHFTESVCLSP